MAQTQALIAAQLPAVLADIVASYFQTHGDDPYVLGLSGEHEACMLSCTAVHASIMASAHALQGACAGGHIEMVREMLVAGITITSIALRSAFTAGHRDIAWLLIDCERKGAFELPFAHSCAHRDVSYAREWLGIDTNKINLAYGLSAACLGNQAEVMHFMAAHGPVTCMLCGQRGCDHSPRDSN